MHYAFVSQNNYAVETNVLQGREHQTIPIIDFIIID